MRILPPRQFLIPFLLVHFAASVWLFLNSFTSTMARFDSGAYPTVAERFLEGLSDVLLSPIFTLAARSHVAAALLPGPLGFLPVVANSVLWAVAAWWLVQRVGRLRSRREARASD